MEKGFSQQLAVFEEAIWEQNPREMERYSILWLCGFAFVWDIKMTVFHHLFCKSSYKGSLSWLHKISRLMQRTILSLCGYKP